MARRKATAGEPFTMVPQSWLPALHKAGVPASEILVLMALTQRRQRNGLYSRPVADYGEHRDGVDQTGISTATGLSVSQVTHALSNLCTKRRVASTEGGEVPVLEAVVKGHRGRVAVYRCNLPPVKPPARRGRRKPTTGGKGGVADGTKNGHEKKAIRDAQSGPELCVTDGSTVKPAVTHHLEKRLEGRLEPPPL